MIIPIHKPSGPTSYDIIRQLKKITQISKIGHAGTLDPMAEGVLVVGITREGTKQLHQLIKKGKTYQAVLTLGAGSDTHDAEGKITPRAVKTQPTLAQIQAVAQDFVGEIEQIPPRYSAVKLKGTPAYKLARQGKEFQLQPKLVKIYQITIDDYQYPSLKLTVKTGSGVYVRSLARDIGARLKTNAYLTKLVRTQVGDFVLKDALTIEEFAEFWQKQEESSSAGQVTD